MTDVDWRIHVLNQGPRLLSTARGAMVDANEAHLLVHTVIAKALGNASGGELQDMHEQLGRLVRRRAKQPVLADPPSGERGLD
ncbi:MAG: hypothetical protein A4S17_01710 [Proteobacteria bacterium HN_bin10]|jgi:hypothetical protein|nr:MAG: hypothetical protein A4S17_01710 [Proteobacteria bacterium HN_bin10]